MAFPGIFPKLLHYWMMDFIIIDYERHNLDYQVWCVWFTVHVDRAIFREGVGRNVHR